MGRAWSNFKRHLLIVCKGLDRAFCGTFVMALLAISIRGFVMVSTGEGWAAVAYFVISTVVLALFGVCVYIMGKGGRNA